MDIVTCIHGMFIDLIILFSTGDTSPAFKMWRFSRYLQPGFSILSRRRVSTKSTLQITFDTRREPRYKINSENLVCIFTEVWGKVMFSQVFVCSLGGGVVKAVSTTPPPGSRGRPPPPDPKADPPPDPEGDTPSLVEMVPLPW